MSQRPADIQTLVRQQGELRPDAPAIETERGATLTYGALRDRIGLIASSIAEHVRKPGGGRPRIGLVFPNGSEIAVALLASAIAGEAAPFNPASKAAELDAYFRSCRLDALIVPEDYNGPAVTVAEKSGLRLLRLQPCGGLLGITPSGKPLPAPDPDDIALVLMTSGSTGRPKIVPLSHRNVCTSADDVSRSMDLGPNDRCLTMWEQHHIGGLVDLLMAPIASGGCVVATPGFNAPLFFELLSKAKPTWYQGVPTTLNELAIHASRHDIAAKPGSLRLVRSVAAALHPKLMAEVETLFGVPVIQTFGMTEAGPLISSTALPPAVRKPGSVGRSCGSEIRIVGLAGESLPPGETGEVAIRGANVFRGYEGDPETNARQFRDGWFHTGDTGYLDADGDLFLTGRIKQLINRGGEKINPQEVDDALLTHPAVSEAACFAVAHKTLGEDISAAAVLREAVSPEELRSYLLQRLAAFKVPHQIAIMEALPRNPVGKVDRLALAEAAASRVASGRTQAPPRDRLEEFLIRLWEKELDVSDIGIHDDFAQLGGDSLSSLRVIAAVEATLGIVMPDDILDDFSPVSRFGVRLSKEGIDPDATSFKGADIPVSEADIGGVLESTGVGSAGSPDDFDETLRKMATSATRREFQTAADIMTAYRTPAELRHVVTALPGISFAGKSSLVSKIRTGILRRRWRIALKKHIGSSTAADAWRRRQVFPHIILYGSAEGERKSRNLIVGFSGNYMRLMVPTYRVLCNLDPAKTDLLVLSDPKRAGFIKGLEGLGSGVEAIEDWLQEFVNDNTYDSVIALGTSGGAIAAIHAAVALSLKRVTAVGAATPSRHADMAAALREIAPRHRAGATEIILAYSEGNARDSDAATQIKGILPEAALRPDKRFTDHNLIDKLFHAGELDRFLTEVQAQTIKA